MPSFPIAEAKNRFSELVARAEAGEDIAVTRHGKPVARLVPARARIGSKSRQAQTQQAFQRLAQLRRGTTLDGDLKAIARQGLD